MRSNLKLSNKSRQKIVEKYEASLNELVKFKTEDAVEFCKDLLSKSPSHPFLKPVSIRVSTPNLLERSENKHYLSFSSEDDEEEKKPLENITTCSSNQDLTIDKLRQLELKSKRQALNISLFGTLVDDYMKCAKLSNPEESRLGLDEAENAPFVFPSALSTDNRQPAELSRTSLQVGSKTLRQSSLFHAQKAYFTETKVLSALPLQDEKLETSIKIKTLNFNY